MLTLFQTAAGITTIWGLAGIAIVALLYFRNKQRGKVPPIAWAVVIGIVALALVPTLGWLQLQHEGIHQKDIYHLRVTVLDPQNTPVNDARVWSSTDAIPKKVDGGWEFSIPAGSKPSDGKLTIYAQVENSFWRGTRDVQLADDYYPTAAVLLSADDRAQIRGIVTDAAGRAVTGARVSVVGYPAEAVSTKEDGNFVLPAHAADGQQVELHAEKQRKAVDQWHPAGRFPATLVLSGNK
jgi:hypothetical protein